MRAAPAALALALAAPAAAVTPLATEDALAPGTLALAAPGVAACLAGWTDAEAVTYARVLLPAREIVVVQIRHRNGARTDCDASLGRAEVLRRAAANPADAPSGPRPPPRAFAPARRCDAARPVQGLDGRLLGWIEEPPCR